MGPGETVTRHEKNTAALECGFGGPETMGRWGAGFVVLDGFWCLFSGGWLRTGAWFWNHSPWVAVQSLDRSIGGGSNRQRLVHANCGATEYFQDPICLRIFSLSAPPPDVLSGIAVPVPSEFNLIRHLTVPNRRMRDPTIGPLAVYRSANSSTSKCSLRNTQKARNGKKVRRPGVSSGHSPYSLSSVSCVSWSIVCYDNYQ